MERHEIASRDIRPMTVCIIDDDAATRESLRVVLADVGYDIVEAADGVEARALLEANQIPMVVLLDNQMPLLDGGAILNLALHHETLRERYAYIVMSASPMRATSAWFDAITTLQVPVLAKPFDIGALLQAIRDAERRLERAV
jgi:CheY-like chemotaxis protein